MNFGEKLLQLRKESAMSQEILAEQLNTSRQAVSRWENNQGFPETEKIIKIGNIFDVSIDYLLKDTNEKKIDKVSGYYVNNELIQGFLAHEKKIAKYGALGISIIILSIIPYIMFKNISQSYFIIIALMISAGIVLFLKACSMEDEYKVIKKEPLLFDDRVLSELREKYNIISKRYTLMILISIFIIITSSLSLFLLKSYYLIPIFLIAIGIYFFIYFASIIDSYNILINNEKHMNKLSYKVLRKIKEKKDML